MALTLCDRSGWRRHNELSVAVRQRRATDYLGAALGDRCPGLALKVDDVGIAARHQDLTEMEIAMDCGSSTSRPDFARRRIQATTAPRTPRRAFARSRSCSRSQSDGTDRIVSFLNSLFDFLNPKCHVRRRASFGANASSAVPRAKTECISPSRRPIAAMTPHNRRAVRLLTLCRAPWYHSSSARVRWSNVQVQPSP